MSHYGVGGRQRDRWEAACGRGGDACQTGDHVWVYPFVGFMFVLSTFLRENFFSMYKNIQEGDERDAVCRTLICLVARPLGLLQGPASSEFPRPWDDCSVLAPSVGLSL